MSTAPKSYSEMKESGEPWLGSIPGHWDAPRMRNLLHERVEKGHPDEPLLAATQTKGVVRKEDYENRTVLATKDLHLLKLVLADDFVISLRSFQGGIEYARARGIISPAYTVLFARNPETQPYLSWLFKSLPFIENLSIHVTGIRQGQNVSYESLGRSRLPQPPLAEQRAIVGFLDRFDRRVRRCIRTKRRLMQLLEEQKRSVIHKAVTYGISGAVQLKPSGVEWQGEVPTHWTVMPLKRAFERLDYGISEPSSDTGTVRTLTMRHIRDGRVEVPEYGGVSDVDPDLLLQPGDLLFNRTNSLELVGKVGLFEGADGPVTFASYLVRMRPLQDSDSGYLNMVLNDSAFLSLVRSEAIPSLHQANLNPTRYGRIKVALPGISEQRAIREWVESVCRPLDAARSEIRREVSLIEEYRARLIADVVTGKRDVGLESPDLPMEQAEQQVEMSELADDPADLVDEIEGSGVEE